MLTEEQIAWISSVGREDGGGCRDWPWSTNNYGYGYVRLNGNSVPVGHLTMTANGRPRPETGGRWQLHSCDRPICAAPWHLRWGTAAENLADARSRNRMNMAHGEGHHWHKLTDDKVRFMRANRHLMNIELAEMFGVTIGAISAARRGITWKHVDTPPSAPRPNGAASRRVA